MSNREIITNYGASIQKKLFNYAKLNGKDNRDVMIKYLHDRFLYRISISDYCENFVLKGSALVYVYMLDDSRNTKDVDFMGRGFDSANLKNIIQEIASLKCEEDGVIFLPETVSIYKLDKHNGYDGFRVTVQCKLGKAREVVKMDLSFNEVITPSSVKQKYPSLIDCVPDVYINTYTLETSIAEKIESIVSKAAVTTRMKDFYDIYKIMNNPNIKLNNSILKEAIKNTFTHRHTIIDKDSIVFKIDYYVEVNRTNLWHSFLKKNRLPDLSFYEVGLFICNYIPKFM